MQEFLFQDKASLNQRKRLAHPEVTSKAMGFSGQQEGSS